MAEKPVGEFTPLADHFKKVRQFIRSIGWIDLLHHTAGSAVGENTVYRPVDPFQFARASWYSSSWASPPSHQLTPLTRNMDRIRRISQYWRSKSGRRDQDSILNIMGGRTAHCEPGEAAEVEDLSPHKVQDMLPHNMDPSAIPFFFLVECSTSQNSHGSHPRTGW